MTHHNPTVDHIGVREDPRVATDDARGRCPVAYDGNGWGALGHAEVVTVATDPDLYSSAHPTRRAIPNSLDGDEHTAYRKIVDQHLTPERVAREEPRSRRVAATLVAQLPRDAAVRAIFDIGTPFAVRAQCAWLGWPARVENELASWMRDSQAATRSGDRARTAAVADGFDAMIRSLLDERRGRPAKDVTGEVMHETVHGRPLTDDEVVSILRNWTAGDLSSLAASVGVIAYLIATRPEIQEEVRSRVAAGDAAWVESAIEELLRIDDPFLTNRRTATTMTTLGGEHIRAGDRVQLSWPSANRDSSVFPDPDAFDPAANAPHNLVFGIGPHVCPGRGLTLMELRVVLEELVRATAWIELVPGHSPVRETPPMGGWAEVEVVLT